MSKTDGVLILAVFCIIAGWKVLTMSNMPWWICVAASGAFALLLMFDRLQKNKNSG